MFPADERGELWVSVYKRNESCRGARGLVFFTGDVPSSERLSMAGCLFISISRWEAAILALA